MILSDRDIKARILKGDIVVQSPDNDHLPNVGASSMDLRLGKYFKTHVLEVAAEAGKYFSIRMDVERQIG